MQSVIWFFLWPMCVSFFCTYVFYVLRDEVVDRPGKNQPEHAQGWLGSKSHWVFLLLVVLVILKFPGDSDKGKKKKASPDKDYMFGTLTQLERDLVNFVSKVHNLKLTAATTGNRKCPYIEVPADRHNNITIYEVWGDNDDSN
ncbi:hypothetical protein ABFV05_020004 [Capra hircus]